MKIRMGFVSNSSSSSFVCDICGEVYEGWDASPFDSAYDCSQCPNEHVMCNKHLKEGYEEPLSEDEENSVYGGNVSSKYCPICQFENYSESQMAKYLEKTRKINRDEVFQEVKAINKRRKKLYDSEYITYVCKKFDLTDEILLKETKEKFGDYKNLIKFIGGLCED